LRKIYLQKNLLYQIKILTSFFKFPLTKFLLLAMVSWDFPKKSVGNIL